MKKGLILLMSIILVISIFAGCKTTEHINSQIDPAVLSNGLYQITVPEDWPEKILVETTEHRIKIYQKSAHESFGGGWLCTIAAYTDDVYMELPCHEIIMESENTGTTFVAEYPSDVQADVENQESMAEYFEMFEKLPEIIKTFELVD